MSAGPEKPREKLKFKPLNKGLGFHPFSDGLPYAQNLNKGAGAVQAGPARFAFPPAAAKSTVTTALRPVESVSSAPRLPTPPLPVRQVGAASIAASPDPSPKIEIASYGFFYLLKRVIAYSFDSVLNIGLCLGGLVFALYRMNMDLTQLGNVEIIFAGGMFLLLFNWALISAQEIAFHTSVGKKLMGLRVSGAPAAIFLRSFFFLISFAFLGLGLIWSLFDQRRRCWHDVAADIQPEEIADL